jgi:hypothetical protein
MALPWDVVWFYNSINGAVTNQPAIGDTITAHLPGEHGPFSSQQQALNYYALNKTTHPAWAAPTGLAGNVENTATSAATDAAQGVAGSLINFVKQGSIWERGAEVVVGILILYIGLKAIASPAGVKAGTQGATDAAKSTGRGVKAGGGRARSAAGMVVPLANKAPKSRRGRVVRDVVLAAPK